MCASTKAPLTDKMNRGAMAVNCHVFVQMPNKDFISAGKGEFGFISDLKIFLCIKISVFYSTTRSDHKIQPFCKEKYKDKITYSLYNFCIIIF